MSEITPKVTKEEYLRAVAEGIRCGIMDIATNGTDMPSADFYEAVRRGVKEGTEEAHR